MRAHNHIYTDAISVKVTMTSMKSNCKICVRDDDVLERDERG